MTHGAAVEGVYEALLIKLSNGELKPGEHVGEEQAASELGVSRTSVRSALQLLTGQGLLVKNRHLGCRVVSFGVGEIAEVFGAREVLEGLGARLLSLRANDAEVAQLRELCKALDDEPPTLSGMQARMSEVAFHRNIVSGCGTLHLPNLANAEALIIMAFINYNSFTNSVPNIPAVLKLLEGRGEVRHDAIVDAIEAHDAVRAEELARGHVSESRDTLLRNLHILSTSGWTSQAAQ